MSENMRTVMMMELNESLFVYLSSYESLSDLVGTKIYKGVPESNPSDILPYITYSLVSESETETFKQPDKNGLISSIYQFDVWASTRTSVASISKQLRKAFKNLTGQIGGTEGVILSAVRKVSRTTDIEEKNGAIVAYRDLQEFEIWHYETE